MRKRKWIKALVALTLVAAMLCGSAMAASLGAKVFSTSMSVYSSPNRVVGALKRGTSFKVTAIRGNWARISYKGHTGYAKLNDIIFNNRISAMSTKSSSIRFMTKDSYKKGVYYTGTLAAGVPLKLAGIHGDYYLFFDQSGNTMGFVKKSAVGSQTVYITKGDDGICYHNAGCPVLKRKNVQSKKTTLTEALLMGYKQCGTKGDWK